jgi:hypothetical protein
MMHNEDNEQRRQRTTTWGKKSPLVSIGNEDIFVQALRQRNLPHEKRLNNKNKQKQKHKLKAILSHVIERLEILQVGYLEHLVRAQHEDGE